MRRLLPILVILFLVPNIALADGGFFPPDEYIHMYIPEQKAIITWDGTTETMILSSKFSSDRLPNTAWIVPLPSSTDPGVEAGNITVFRRFVDYFAPPEAYPMFAPFIGALEARIGVEVIEIKKVDIYDVAILKATDASALVDWLNDNGYYVPPETIPVIEKYTGPDHYLIANKVDLKNKYIDIIEKLVQINATFENMTLDEQSYVVESYFMEHSRDPRVREFRNTFHDLQEGLATPLEFTFTPPEPFYPLEISSINKGRTRIEIYIAAPTAMKDSNNILSVDEALTITHSFRSEVAEFIDLGDAQVITRLDYSGDLASLIADAEFAPSPETSVENVHLRELKATLETIPILILTAIILSILVGTMFLICLFLGLFGIWFHTKKKLQKRFDWKWAALGGYIVGALILVASAKEIFYSPPYLQALFAHFILTAVFLVFFERRKIENYVALILAYVCASVLTAFVLSMATPFFIF